MMGWFKNKYIKEHSAEMWEELSKSDKIALYQKWWNSVNANKREKLNEKLKSEIGHKGGKYYDRQREYWTRGLPCARKKIRNKYGSRYREYKKIIAPNSQIHFQWLPNLAEFDAVAIVEADAHMHGFIDVIWIVEGEITLFTEKEVRVRVK